MVGEEKNNHNDGKIIFFGVSGKKFDSTKRKRDRPTDRETVYERMYIHAYRESTSQQEHREISLSFPT